MPHPAPFDLVFSGFADERFPRIRQALETAGRNPGDRDAFLMEREVVFLLHELRPDEGLGEGIDQLAALLHHAYLYWDAKRPGLTVGEDALGELLGERGPATVDPSDVPQAFYAELPERRIWAEVLEGEPPEPLDGCFVHAAGEEISVLGVFGVRPERMGFSVVEARGARQRALARPDGGALFASTLPGGPAARLHSLAGGEELLELGWRLRALMAGSLSGAGRWTR